MILYWLFIYTLQWKYGFKWWSQLHPNPEYCEESWLNVAYVASKAVKLRFCQYKKLLCCSPDCCHRPLFKTLMGSMLSLLLFVIMYRGSHACLCLKTCIYGISLLN